LDLKFGFDDLEKFVGSLIAALESAVAARGWGSAASAFFCRVLAALEAWGNRFSRDDLP
jgi:hypothetical protein